MIKVVSTGNSVMLWTRVDMATTVKDGLACWQTTMTSRWTSPIQIVGSTIFHQKAERKTNINLLANKKRKQGKPCHSRCSDPHLYVPKEQERPCQAWIPNCMMKNVSLHSNDERVPHLSDGHQDRLPSPKEKRPSESNSVIWNRNITPHPKPDSRISTLQPRENRTHSRQKRRKGDERERERETHYSGFILHEADHHKQDRFSGATRHSQPTTI